MASFADTAGRVRSALAGEPGTPVGLAFVPPSSLEALRWGGRGMPRLLVSVCERLRPDFTFVQWGKPWSDAAVDGLLECGTQPFWVVPGPLGATAEQQGWRETLAGAAAPDAGWQSALESSMPKLLEAVRRGLRLGVSGVVVAEDLAGADGFLIAPDLLLERVVPLLGQLAEPALEAGVPAVLHSDGDITAMVHAVRRGGFSAVHVGGLGWERFLRMFQIARGEGLAVFGGLETRDLSEGLPSAMRAGVQAGLLAETAGGLLLCDDGGITEPEQMEALVTSLQAARGIGADGGVDEPDA